jgi:GNAT superfamily N-acetyltransferase
VIPEPGWTVEVVSVESEEALALLRDYYIDVSDRYYQHHFGRDSTPTEIEEGLAESPSDSLAPPTGVFLVGRYDGIPAACAGLMLLDVHTVELKRLFVRHARRGTGGGARLLAAAEEAARGLGAARIVLNTRLDLVEARALYRGHGYAEIPALRTEKHAELWFGKRLR